MGKPIIFDRHPYPSRTVTIARAIALFAYFLIIPALLLFGKAGANPVGAIAFAVLCLVMVLVEILAIVRHTRFSPSDLLVVVAVCGSVAGVLLTLFAEPERYANGTPIYAPLEPKTVVPAVLFFVFVLRGCYKGLRLVMWLENERFVHRAEFLLLGVAGYLASIGWKVLAALSIIYLFEFLFRRGQEEELLLLAIGCGLLAPLFYVIARAHLAYRRKAQERFDADPEALGPAGRLEPAGGVYRMKDLLGDLLNRIGFSAGESKEDDKDDADEKAE